ncbi:MAG: hypothetical protein QXO70_00045 [Candidatus Pacearchaeota archaeon]
MAEETPVFKGKLKHSGLFDFKELYKFCYNFWKENKEYLITEKSYGEKITPTGKEIEIEWETMKKVSDYFKLTAKIKWRIVGFTEVEAEREGKKIKINKGEIEISVESKLVRDYEGKWESSPSLKFFRSIYDKYIIKNKIEEMEDKIFGDSDEFLAQVKAFLALEAKR